MRDDLKAGTGQIPNCPRCDTAPTLEYKARFYTNPFRPDLKGSPFYACLSCKLCTPRSEDEHEAEDNWHELLHQEANREKVPTGDYAAMSIDELQDAINSGERWVAITAALELGRRIERGQS